MRNKNAIIISVTIFIFTALVFLLDIYLSIDCNLNDLIIILFPSVLTLIGLWITGYFLIIQFYKNRLPFEKMQSDYLQLNIIIIYLIINSIIWGSMLVAFGQGFISQIIFIIELLVIIILIIRSSIKLNKTAMIKSCVEDYANSIERELKRSCLDSHSIKKNFNNIIKIFEESIIKDEYFVCNCISGKMGDIFVSIMKEYNEIIIENKITQEKKDVFFDKVIKVSLEEIYLAKDCKSEFLIETLINQCYKNIEISIKIKQFHLFKRFISGINYQIYRMQKQKNDKIVNHFIQMYKDMIVDLQRLKYHNWIEYIIDENYELTLALNYINKDTNLKYFANLLLDSIRDAVRVKDEELYKYYYVKLRDFTIMASNINHEMERLVPYYSFYSSLIISKGNITKIKEYLDILDIILLDVIKNDRWLDYIFYLFMQLKEKWDDEFSDTILRKNIDILENLISSDLQIKNPIFVPNFKDIVQKNQYKSEKIREICKDFTRLFRIAIINKNTSFFYLFGEKLRECIISLESRSKDIQKLLFNVFFAQLRRLKTIGDKSLEDSKLLDIILSELDECITTLDNANNISKDLGNYIISKMTKLASEDYMTSEYFINQIIEFLRLFVGRNKHYKFMINAEKLRALSESLYKIGLYSLENNKENCLKAVSNAIGWIIIACFEREQIYIIDDYICRVGELYKLSKELNVSETTQLFVMTLFTTIGTYCSKHINYHSTRDLIYNIIKNEDEQLIHTAIKLRTNTFNDGIFENRGKEFAKEFKSEFYKYKNCDSSR